MSRWLEDRSRYSTRPLSRDDSRHREFTNNKQDYKVQISLLNYKEVRTALHLSLSNRSKWYQHHYSVETYQWYKTWHMWRRQAVVQCCPCLLGVEKTGAVGICLPPGYWFDSEDYCIEQEEENTMNTPDTIWRPRLCRWSGSSFPQLPQYELDSSSTQLNRNKHHCPDTSDSCW